MAGVPPETQLYRQLPAVDQVLLRPDFSDLIRHFGRELILDEVQKSLAGLRELIGQNRVDQPGLEARLATLAMDVRANIENRLTPSLRKLINATGVIVHTNAGRAPLASTVAAAVSEVAAGYSNLEYDLAAGTRGKREMHLESRLTRLLGCGGAVVCNNNAAAVFLILNTLAAGKKVLVSRGELVEIGGSFRIPSIMERSQAILREVGTTNKTRLADFRDAIDSDTGLILKVHPSNYRIVGFTDSASLPELAALGREHGIPVVMDSGSGLLFDHPHPCLREEPSAHGCLEQGADLVCFSGDKLLGGPQAGIVVGRSDLVAQLRKNPIMRVVRVDKMSYTALERTLIEYERGSADEHIPVHRMLHLTADEIRVRAEAIRDSLSTSPLLAKVRPGLSVLGGGSAPGQEIDTFLLAVRSDSISASAIERKLRYHHPPVLARIEDDELVLDLRTVFPHEDGLVAEALLKIARAGLD